MDKITNGNAFNLLDRPFKLQNQRGKLPDGFKPVSAHRDSVELSERAAVASQVIFQSVSYQFAQSSQLVQTNKVPVASESNDSSFDIDAVISTIYDFVSSSIANAKGNGATDDELKQMFTQAKEGINLGLDQALEELEDMDLLNDDISTGVATSRERLEEKLTKLEERFFAPEGTKDIGRQTLQAYAGAQQISESSVLELTTKDGDKVNIYFGQQDAVGVVGGRFSDGQSSASALSFTSSSYSELSYTIEGDLSDGEKQAISDLIAQVAEVQESFFTNDIESALSKVKDLNIDFDQLSTVSIELTQSYSYAAKSYQEVAAIDNTADDFKAITDEVDRISSFMEQLSLLKEKASDKFAMNNGQFIGLMNAVLEQSFKPESKSADAFNRIAEQLFPVDIKDNKDKNEKTA